MAILLDKEGLQNYANKMVLAENRKVGNKSLPSALADIDGLIDEMKGQFEAEYGSALDMKLENNENVFSVGTGSGVDRRSEVENSFTDIGLSGESLVNLCKEKKLTLTTSHKLQLEHLPQNGKTYTFIVDILKETTATTGYIFRMNYDGGYIGVFEGVEDIVPSTRRIKAVKVTKEIISVGLWHRVEGNVLAVDNMIILEGDYTNKPLPQYFEGLKSIGEVEGNKIEVSSVGKNLANLSQGYEKLFPQPYSPNGNKYEYYEDGFKLKDNAGRIAKTSVLNNFKSGKKYVASFTFENIKLTNENNRVATYFTTVDNIETYTSSFTKDGRYSVLINLSNRLDLKRFAFYFDSENFGSEVTIKDFMIEEVKTTDNIYTQFEPYKIDKKQISLNEPLRGLPNGVRDTIEIINGEWKIVRRCGARCVDGINDVFNGCYESSSKINTYEATLNSKNTKSESKGICNRYPNIISYSLDSEHFYTYSNSGSVFFINKNKIDSKVGNTLLEKVNNLAKLEPIEIIYELETPTIEDIDPLTLQCWKNGTILIDSVIPPVTTHTVALNKPAQIKRNIEELTTLRHRVKTLEEQYDQIALEQAHKLELLNHSFELDYNI